MKLEVTFPGAESPFEGDRTIRLQGIPEGAHITKAKATVTFVKSEIDIDFTDGGQTWGATKEKATVPTDEGTSAYVIVDFHTQRTVTKLVGIEYEPPSVEGFSLQIDLGGVWASVKDDGTLLGPGEPPVFFTRGDGIPQLRVQRLKLTSRPIIPVKPSEKFTLHPPFTVVGEGLKYTWQQVLGPSVTLSDLTAEKPTFYPPDDDGVLLAFKVTVTDGLSMSWSGKVFIFVTSEDSVTPQLDLTAVVCDSYPSNVTLSLGDEEPFWVYPGELSDSVETRDFAEFLNAYLDQAEAIGGYYLVPLTIHSDTIAFLNVTFTIEYYLERQLPEKTIVFTSANLRDPSHMLELQLPYGATVVQGQAGLTLTGGFEADRIVPGAVEEGEQRLPLEVTPGRTLAQALRLPAHYDVTAVDLHLAKPYTRSEIHVSLQTNAAGKPSGQVLATAEVQPEKLAAEGAQWTTLTLPEAVKLNKNTTYWLVLSALEGRAEWSGRPRPVGAGELRHTTDGGLSWQVSQSEEETPRPLVGLYRLRFVPPASQFEPPLAVQVGVGAEAVEVPLDTYRQLGRLDFDLSFDRELGTYLEKSWEAVPACVPGERVVNGDFRDWSPGAAPERWTVDSGVVQRFYWTLAQLGIYYLFPFFKSFPRTLYIAGGHEYELSFQGTPSGESPPTFRFCFRWLDASQQVLDVTEATLGPALYETRQTAPAAAASVEITVEVISGDPSDWETTQVVFRLAEKTVLSQAVSVTPECMYDLSFLVFAWGVLGQAEVRWLDTKGTVLSTDVVDVVEPESESVWFPLCRSRLAAPKEATSAEVRLIQPEGGIMFVTHLSLFATTNLVSNGDFAIWETPIEGSHQPQGWSRISGTVSSERSPHIDTQAVRLGPDNEETVLQQTNIPVTAGQAYEFRFQAVVEAAQPAQAEIRWADEAGQELPGEIILMSIEPDRLGPYAYGGQVPAGATQATIRFVQPAGDQCLVGNVALRPIDSVSAPLVFLAETPGELALLDPHVAYDLPELPRPPQPSIWLPFWLPLQRRLMAMIRQPPVIQPVVEPAAPPPRSPLAGRSIGIIAGVGDRFSSIFEGLPAPVTTIAELAELGTEAEIEGIARERRLELKTKAEMVVTHAVETAPFATLADESLETLLVLPPAELARRAGQPTARAEQLQRDLRALRLLLKNDAFRSLRLSDLGRARHEQGK